MVSLGGKTAIKTDLMPLIASNRHDKDSGEGPFREREPTPSDIMSAVADLKRDITALAHMTRVPDIQLPEKKKSIKESTKEQVDKFTHSSFAFWCFHYPVRYLTVGIGTMAILYSLFAIAVGNSELAAEHSRERMHEDCDTACHAMDAEYVTYHHRDFELTSCSCASYDDHRLFTIVGPDGEPLTADPAIEVVPGTAESSSP